MLVSKRLMTIRNSNLLWKTLAQAKGATSIGTP